MTNRGSDTDSSRGNHLNGIQGEPRSSAPPPATLSLPIWEAELLATLLFRLGLTLCLVYALVVGFGTLPFLPSDPAWQIRTSTLLLDNAPLPLIGLVAAITGAHLNPQHPGLRLSLRVLLGLALVVSLGFLLLIPLQAGAARRLHSLANRERQVQLDQARQRSIRLREALGGVASIPELQRRWAEAEGPPIRVEPGVSLQQLRGQLTDLLKRTDDTLLGQQRRTSADNRQGLMQRTARGSLLALVFAVAFASASFRGRLIEDPAPMEAEVDLQDIDRA